MPAIGTASPLANVLPLLVVLLTTACCTAAAAPTADTTWNTGSFTRTLLQAANTSLGSGSLDPVVPLSQLPGEELPSGLDALQMSAGSVSVSLVLKGTTAAEFRSNYQATIATITGTATGTPAARWQFKVGNALDLGKVTSVNSSNITSSPAGAAVQPNITSNVSTINQTAVTVNGSIANSSGATQNSSSSTEQVSAGNSSPATSGTARSTGARRTLLQQVGSDLKVSLSIITAKPQVVAYRLAKASSPSADAAAAAVANTCSSEYCSRLVAAGLPVDGSSIQISPDISTIVTNPGGISIKSAAEQEAEARSKFLGAVFGGTIGGALVLLLIGLVAHKLLKKHRNQKQPTATNNGSKSSRIGMFSGPKQLELHSWGKFNPKFGSHTTGLALNQSNNLDSALPDTPSSVQLAALAAAAAAAQRATGSGVHPTPFSSAKQQSPAEVARSNSTGNLAYPPQAVVDGMFPGWAASGVQTPSFFPTVLSTYGTPGISGTPDLAANPELAMVRPEQLNQALQQYWASVQNLQGMLSAQATPKMTPQHTPGFLSPKRTPQQSPKVTPMHSPKGTPRGSPRFLSPVKTRSGGYDVLQ